MDIDLEEILSEFGSLIELEKAASEAGKEFSGSRDYINWVRSTWKSSLEEQIFNPADYADHTGTLPTIVVEDENVEYHIHGIAHGWPKYLAPGWHARDRIKDVVSAAADAYDRPTQGETYFYEERMHKIFDLDHSKELPDVTETGDESLSGWKMAGRLAVGIPLSLGSMLAFPLIFGVANLSARPNISQEAYLMKESLKDECSLAAAADYLRHQNLPEPFNLEKKYLEKKDSRMQKWLSMLEPKGLATASERSLWTARELRQRSGEFEKVHYIGGLAHMTEIAYFLENPDYDFSVLEAFRLEINEETE